MWFFYYRRDVFKNLTDSGNYYSGVVDVVSDSQYETESLKRIYSRWVPSGGRSIAEDVAGRFKARYLNAPRRFSFKLFGTQDISLGQTLPISHWSLEDAHGSQATSNVIVTGIKTMPNGYLIDSEEITFDSSGVAGDKTLDVPVNSFNVNLRALYDTQYASVDEVNNITFIIPSGVKVGSLNRLKPAIDLGEWPLGATLFIENNGTIVGKGGDSIGKESV